MNESGTLRPTSLGTNPSPTRAGLELQKFICLRSVLPFDGSFRCLNPPRIFMTYWPPDGEERARVTSKRTGHSNSVYEHDGICRDTIDMCTRVSLLSRATWRVEEVQNPGIRTRTVRKPELLLEINYGTSHFLCDSFI